MILSLILGAMIVLAIFTSVFFVGTKEVVTITRFGRFVRIARPGINFRIPFFIEDVDFRLSTKLLYSVESVNVKTRDNAYVEMPVQIYYQVNNANIDTICAAAYNLDNPKRQITQLSVKEVRSRANTMELEELFMDKDSIEVGVKADLDSFVTENGYFITNVVIDEPAPSEEVQRASNDVIASSRLKDAASAKAEALRIERVGEAQADAQALKERANAFADSRSTIATGMTEAAQAMRDRVEGLDDKEIINVLEGVDYRDMLISCSKGPGTIIVGTEGQHGNTGEMVGMMQGLANGMPANANRAVAQASGERHE